MLIQLVQHIQAVLVAMKFQDYLAYLEQNRELMPQQEKCPAFVCLVVVLLIRGKLENLNTKLKI